MKITIGRRGILLLAMGATLVAGGGIAYATIPDAGTGVYHACMLKSTGTIRIIDPSLPSGNLLSRCTSLETEIKWSQQGPKGDPGPQGLPGPAGVSGWNVVETQESFTPGYQKKVVATCPAGTKPLGGGYFPVNNQSALDVLGSYPADSNGGSIMPGQSSSQFASWVLYARNTSLDFDASVEVYAICANA